MYFGIAYAHRKNENSIEDQTSHIPLLVGHQSKFRKGWLVVSGRNCKENVWHFRCIRESSSCENSSASVVLLSITNILLAASSVFSHSHFLYLARLPLS